ncbi:MAG TPA: hypothetical protein VG324_29905, partial [Blastocatellia bacterium]|nr:hypothetical protein [Blastocatellia bacterium]
PSNWDRQALPSDGLRAKPAEIMTIIHNAASDRVHFRRPPTPQLEAKGFHIEWRLFIFYLAYSIFLFEFAIGSDSDNEK